MRRLQNQIRLVVSCGLGALFLAESFNPDLWRPNNASLSPLAHLCIGIFGLLWFIQTFAIQRTLRKPTP
jgi:hypothetical protein